ncbi:MAG: hypothetical protein RL199_330 [Pseudomonadota bacterium]|jgi:effector-binding domain-containing protein
MLDEPRVLSLESMAIAALPVVCSRDGIRTVMGPGLGELHGAVAEQGVEVTGPWFTHHLRIDDTGFDFEICLPVSRPIEAAGRVRPSVWPAMRAARTTYRGPFDGLGPAWGEFMGWVAAQGHTPATDLWERYLVGPETTTDPSQWATELTRPLAGEG